MRVMAGKMDRRVTLQRPVRADDGHGGKVTTWTDVATVYAEVKDLKGNEFFAAQQEQHELTTRFIMRYRADLQTSWRIRYRETDYDLVQIAEIGRREGHDILARVRQ